MVGVWREPPAEATKLMTASVDRTRAAVAVAIRGLRTQPAEPPGWVVIRTDPNGRPENSPEHLLGAEARAG
jgi:hypothetical protein